MSETKQVLLIRSKSGMLISVGAPESYKGASIVKYLKDECTLETISIEEYRKRDLKLDQIN